MKVDIKALAISSILILESLALYKGIDGVMFATAIAGIAGIAGFDLGRVWGGRGGGFVPSVNVPSYVKKYN